MLDQSDAALARSLAQQAGQELLLLRDKLGFGDATVLRREGDQRAHEFLMSALAEFRPGDAILSEEGKGEQGRTGASRLNAERVWIVDPLDGTREYAEAGRDDWAVHVALWERGTLSAGAVALPAQDTVLGADAPPTPLPPQGRIRMVVSRSRPAAFLTALAEVIDAELVPMGSAGAKTAAVITGKVDAYVHAGGQYEWDSAAPVAVARAAGLHTSRIDGTDLTYNNSDPKLSDLVVCRPELSALILKGIAAVRLHPLPTQGSINQFIKGGADERLRLSRQSS
ncbi:3'(2'),5'-bisphosphate nucleotidase CysQ [Stackebrandtia nassauensis]|uniref:Inositol monophosphatase n=1 Tax=Stackebrandtia nassauensis (strain DSM 44728 / CIP 108903 / NRRL B-16338 / NBRC 102104 / LLR-40K-21) TaxID=446470 RepID=D3PU57_STANL|nr:3'(2'),5'-bisphosphate nucleotidase CysQ [Stackebrandtia nassauensis]ADD41003.1 inositol monophosphatase [Stackebrandtia nassauensis DSM 44728]